MDNERRYDEGRRYDDGRVHHDYNKTSHTTHHRMDRQNWLLPLLAGLLGLGLLLMTLMRKREPNVTVRAPYAATTTPSTVEVKPTGSTTVTKGM